LYKCSCVYINIISKEKEGKAKSGKKRQIKPSRKNEPPRRPSEKKRVATLIAFFPNLHPAFCYKGRNFHAVQTKMPGRAYYG
jgi:hypothetical protein